MVQRRRYARRMQGFEQLQGIEHAAHAHVVGDAAIHQVDIRPVHAIGQGLALIQLRIARAAGRGGLSDCVNILTQAGTSALQVPP
jgi:hypothetical protein